MVRGKMPAYASAGTQTFAVTVNGTAVENNQITNSCGSRTASGQLPCTYSFPAPAGSDTFVISLGDASYNLLSQGTVAASITSGKTTVLYLTFHGVPDSVHLALDNAAPSVGASSTVHLTAVAYDKSGNQIIGDDYLTPITIASGDASGQTSLSATQFKNPNDVVNVSFTGHLTPAITISVVSPASNLNQPAILKPDAFKIVATTAYTISDLTSGPDGNIWFTECGGNQPNSVCRVGRVTPSGALTESPDIAIPTNGYFERITSGPDGNMWFSEGNNPYVGRVTMSMQMTQMPVKSLSPIEAYDAIPIAAGPDGNIWIADSYRLFKMTPAGAVTAYNPSGLSWPTSIVTGPDGALWMGEGGYIGRLTTSGSYTAYQIPAATFGSMQSNSVFLPDNKLYFIYFTNAVHAAAALQSITTSGTISVVPVNSGTLQGPLSAGPDGKLWGVGQVSGTVPYSGIGRLDPATGDLSVYPYDNAISYGIAASAWGADGNLWLAAGNQIIRFTYAP